MSNLIRDATTWRRISGTLIAVVAIGPLGNRIWDWPNVWPWTLVALVIALLITWWRQGEQQTQDRIAGNRRVMEEGNRKLKEALEQFATFKAVRDLKPDDFGFQYVEPGEDADQGLRPFYHRYIPRQLVRAELVGHSYYEAEIYTESSLIKHLESGNHFVILGQPTMGKTRTLYEVVSGLHDWFIVSPRKDRPVPDSDAFEEIISTRKVVLLLDDLNDFAGSQVDLSLFCSRTRMGLASQWAIAATCRDGAELRVVRDAVDSGIRRLYDDIPLKLTMMAQTLEEKELVATSAGRLDWNPKTGNEYPTPGSIVMEQALRYQRGRFETLPNTQQDVLRAMHILTDLGVLPITHIKLTATLTHVLDRDIPFLGDELDSLAEASFIHRPSRQDPTIPETAYIGSDVVTWADSRGAFTRYEAVKDALLSIEDTFGLLYLGAAVLERSESLLFALECFQNSLKISPNNFMALTPMSSVLLRLGRYAEALEAIELSLKEKPDEEFALLIRGMTLYSSNRSAEAIEVLTRVQESKQYGGRAFHFKGLALSAADRHEEAVEAFNEALKVVPASPEIRRSLGVTLLRIRHFREAHDTYDAILQQRPDDVDSLYGKGVSLLALNIEGEALESFQAILKIDPNSQKALRGIASTHFMRGQTREALEVCDTLLGLDPDDTSVLFLKGMSLLVEQDQSGAREALEALVRLKPDALNANESFGFLRDLIA